MNRLIKLILMTTSALVLVGCATFSRHFDQPQVSVNSFKVLPVSGFNPRFEIGLTVVNPNAIDLPLKGLSYSASIEGNQVFSGVASQLADIPAYGSEDVILEAQADLFAGLRLLNDLLIQREKPIGYTLKVKLDLGTFSLPIYITRKGEVVLPKVK